MSDEEPLFDDFSTLPGHLTDTSTQVMKFAGTYVNLETEKRWFDWPSFKAAVDNYPGSDLTLDKFKSVTINNTVSTVQVMVDKIVDFLQTALNVVMSDADIASLKATLTATYTSLKEKSSKGFLDFKKSTSGHNSSWEYRIQFAFPNPKLRHYFYSLVSTIKLEADIAEESEWWGLTSSSSKNFSASIDAMELVVKEGFTKPK